MAAGGPCSLEERSYRRFLELFLGEFRGPFGAEPSLPSGGGREGAVEEEEEEEEDEEEEGAVKEGEAPEEGEEDAAGAPQEGDGGSHAGEAQPQEPSEEAAPVPVLAAAAPPPAPLLPPLPSLPRPLTEPITEEEVEGECLDLCLQQLYKYNCPSFLAAALARATADEVLRGDLSAYHLPRHADSPDGIIQIETEKLARTVFTKLHEVCSSWVKDFPLHPKPRRYYETSIHAIKNMRRKMEDKHVCIPDFNTLFNLEDQEEQAYFAVFDGHGGVDAAIYASIHLHVNLVHQEMFQRDPTEALCKAFRVTDERFVQKAARECLRCGTTGVVTFIRGNMLYVAWLGDSQVMLVRKGQAVELMKPHKPDREDEKKRIEALGGCVVWFGAWRVNGSLSVSRAIGDAEHKPYICGDADSASTELDGSEDYLLLACDGFFDTMNPDEAVKVVADHLKENNGDSSMVAHKLVASARDAGSSDNITVIVVFLRDMNASVCVSEESEWTENSFQGGQEDNGDDKEDHGDCKRPWPQHQVSAPADLGYDGRVDSFTDRTTLSPEARINVLEEPARLDPRKTEASKIQSAKRLSPDQEMSAGVPKRATLGPGLSAKRERVAEAAPASDKPSGLQASLSLGPATRHACNATSESSPTASLEGEWFASWGRQASLFTHFHFCDAKRWQRLARLKPKLCALLFAHRPLSPCPPAASLSGRRNKGMSHRLWPAPARCGQRHSANILFTLG